MSKVRTSKEFRQCQPDRYQKMPLILEKTGNNLAYTVASVCGSKNPKIREVAVEVDFKGEVPIATLRTRYYGKWSKVTKFPVDLQGASPFNFVPA